MVEEKTIALAQRGDRVALGKILEDAYGFLEEFLSREIRPLFRASISPEDVIQTTYLEASLRFGQLHSSSKGAFLAWLKRIATNNLRDAIREIEARKRPPPKMRIEQVFRDGSFVSLLAILSGNWTTPTGHVSREEIRAAIETALTTLPPVYEAVVRTYDLEGKSMEEVAKAIKKSSAACYMIRARAHERMQELLRDAGQFPSGSA